jgi:hypothetical protein
MLKALLDELSPSDNSSLWNNQKPETAMKKYIIGIVTLAFSLALNSQAAIIQFNLSPAGTDAAVGLSPLNEVPAATNSTGSGNEISAGISFDTETSILTDSRTSPPKPPLCIFTAQPDPEPTRR